MTVPVQVRNILITNESTISMQTVGQACVIPGLIPNAFPAIRFMILNLAPTIIPCIRGYTRLWVVNVLFAPRTGIYPFLFISVSRSIRVQDWFGCWGRCYETMHGENRSNSSWNIILSVSEVVVLSGIPFNVDNQVPTVMPG